MFIGYQVTCCLEVYLCLLGPLYSIFILRQYTNSKYNSFLKLQPPPQKKNIYVIKISTSFKYWGYNHPEWLTELGSFPTGKKTRFEMTLNMSAMGRTVIANSLLFAYRSDVLWRFPYKGQEVSNALWQGCKGVQGLIIWTSVCVGMLQILLRG